jgi:TonB-dependent Receptor Plug Domain
MPKAAWAQVGETLPEVVVTAPRPAPVRRATPAVAPARSAPSRRVSAPAPSRPSTPASAPQIPAFQVVATTPATGLGFDRDKVPAMVQTLPAEDFSRVYSPNVTQTLDQRIPGVFISDVQGNEFTSDLRYRGFAASPLQGTPQGLAVYMQGVRVNEARPERGFFSKPEIDHLVMCITSADAIVGYGATISKASLLMLRFA